MNPSPLESRFERKKTVRRLRGRRRLPEMFSARASRPPFSPSLGKPAFRLRNRPVAQKKPARQSRKPRRKPRRKPQRAKRSRMRRPKHRFEGRSCRRSLPAPARSQPATVPPPTTPSQAPSSTPDACVPPTSALHLRVSNTRAATAAACSRVMAPAGSNRPPPTPSIHPSAATSRTACAA